MEVKGIPPYQLLQQATRSKLFFESNGSPKMTPNSRGKKRQPSTKDMRDILRGADFGFLDFIDRCLEWDPDKRIKPEDALKHS